MTVGNFEQTIAIRDVRKGDRYVGEDGHVGWTAWADAVDWHTKGVHVVIQYPDGGIGTRHWEDPDHEILVLRKP